METDEPETPNSMSLIAELKRRNVFRVGLAYVLMGWVLLQGTDFVLDLIGAPDWVIRVFALAVAVGLPIALFFAWAFEVTPEGIKREADVDRSQSIVGGTGRKLDKLIIGFLALAVVILIGDRFLGNRTDSPPQAATVVSEQATRQDQSIAVLPFRDMSQAGDQGYFGEGIAEELLNALVKIDGLKVASRTSAFSLMDEDLDIPTMADRLGVANILEGSIRTSGNQVRVTAQLINVADDTHLWSETYNGTLDDIFQIQDEITAQILEGLSVQLTGTSPAGTVDQLTDDPEAYRLYLQARSLWRMRNTPSLRQAETILNDVLKRDPDFHRAWSLLAVVAMNLADYDMSADFDAEIDKSKQAANRALALNPDNIEASLVLAENEVMGCDYVKAFDLYEQVLERKPNDPTPYHWYALNLNQTGLLNKALEQIRKAKQIDPLISSLVVTEGIILKNLGEFDASIALMQEGAALGYNGGSPEETIGIEILLGDLSRVDLLVPPETNRMREYAERFVLALKDPSAIEDFERFVFSQPPANYSEGINTASYLATLGSLRLPEYLMTNACTAIPETIWNEPMRDIRGSAEFFQAMETLGVVDYWRQAGWPDDCASLDQSLADCPAE